MDTKFIGYDVRITYDDYNILTKLIDIIEEKK